MTDQLSIRDWELISAYLDGELKHSDAVSLESRLEKGQTLRKSLDELQIVKDLIQSQSTVRTPRNFFVSPEDVGNKPKSRQIAVSLLSLASATTGIMVGILFLFEIISSAPQIYSLSVSEAPQVESFSAEEYVPLAAEEATGEIEIPFSAPERALREGGGAGRYVLTRFR